MHRILYLVSTLKRSGTTIQIYNIAKYLNPQQFELYVITLSPEEEGSMENQFRELNVNVSTLGLSRAQGFLSGKRKLLGKIEKIKPDIIHAQGFRADLYLPALSEKYPVLSSMQIYPFFDYPLLYGRLQGKIMAYRQLAVMKKTKNFIACSKSVSDYFRDRNKFNMKYIQNGVDTGIFYPVSNGEKKDLKARLNVPLDKKIFLTVGVLVPRKDMATVIRGFLNFQKDDAILLIAGGGFEYDKLKALAGDDRRIIFLGDVSNAQEYFQISDYFISASLAEGLPNTVLEAMACGLPVILSRITPHTEVFENNENYPYFFEVTNHDQLTDQLKDILSADHESLSKRMPEIIDEHFSAKNMSEKYQAFYRQLINQA